MLKIEKYSMGIGDRFAHQAKAQLQAMIKAKSEGINVVPVWNKSHREHTTIKSKPADVLKAAEEAVEKLKWKNSFYIDADHIGLDNVDLFIDSSSFFTLDVADFIGEKADSSDIESFIENKKKYIGTLNIPGISETFQISKGTLKEIGEKYLLAVKEADRIYRYLLNKRGQNNFITEVSMDETDEPQSPIELFFILSAIAQEKIPAQTIAPKFSGRFNKGVDYVGDSAKFAKEFDNDLAAVAFATKEFNLPETLKLSIHSGSDKFSIYDSINKTIKKYNAGLHLKTAGTTWLEELIGLAEAEENGLEIAKEIYQKAYNRFDELAAPYSTVIDINADELPSPEEVASWSGKKYAVSLRHKQKCPDYNPNFRQLLHVGYKVAAEMGERYLNALKVNEKIVAENVTENIYERHLKRVFF